MAFGHEVRLRGCPLSTRANYSASCRNHLRGPGRVGLRILRGAVGRYGYGALLLTTSIIHPRCSANEMCLASCNGSRWGTVAITDETDIGCLHWHLRG
jgi:hypothetical protein